MSVKAEDRWGNPANRYRGNVRLSGSGVALGMDEVEFDEDERRRCLDRWMPNHRDG